MPEFSFSLTDTEKTFLKELVRQSIGSRLFPDRFSSEQPVSPSEQLQQPYGAFVTLKMAGDLRGCIGHIVGDKPVIENIWSMAQAAAFEDPRFPALHESEFDVVDIEISILSPLVPCPDLEAIEVGRHGLLVINGQHSGLLLPQVATEWNWDREQFLKQTCNKAGLSPDCYKSPGTTVYWYEAEVF